MAREVAGVWRERRAAVDVGSEELASAVHDQGDGSVLGPQNGFLYSQQGPICDWLSINAAEDSENSV